MGVLDSDEQLDAAALVHMNGRLYDPMLGRFIQADLVVQDPLDPQSLNRYTYVFNNPFAYTDPTGYTASGRPKWVQYAMWAISIYITVQTGFTASAMLNGTYAAGGACLAPSVTGAMFAAGKGGFAAGFTASGGSFKAGLQGAFTSLAFLGAGQLASAPGVDFGEASVGRALIHGVTGGVIEDLSGGKFGHGFVNAGVSKFLNARLVGSETLGDGVMAAVVGGAVSTATGGGFANGATTAAFSYAFSSMAQRVGGAKGGGAGGSARLARGASRGLTAGELGAAESVFGEGMDWGRVRIWNKKYPLHFGFQQDDMAISPNGGDIYFGPAAYMDDFSVSPGSMSFLVHELAHVWQVQNGLGLTFPPRGYNYAPVLAEGGGWAQMTTEGQAEVVADLYLRMNGYRPNCALPIGMSAATLRSLVPFSVPGYQAPSPPSWGWQP